jgi:hypothetical protein
MNTGMANLSGIIPIPVFLLYALDPTQASACTYCEIVLFYLRIIHEV